ncbi:DUF6443 domain-containing protein [Tenacibaculum sp. 190524A02b]|uniref:DUF6443 domain-containing protein n=1 Tax=Tenacibaculum vairaonense TaxID=3137860 RepID=UPI0031FB1900
MKRKLFIFLLGVISLGIHAQSLDKNFTVSVVPKKEMTPTEVNTIVGKTSNINNLVINSPKSNKNFTAGNTIKLVHGAKITSKVRLKIDTLNITDDSFLSEIIYYDGLGRPIQDIAVQQNPEKKDIVQHYQYDQFGRKEKSYLPLPSNQNSGNFINNPVSQINSYYQNKYGDTNPYTQYSLEKSPLSRVVESAAPGNAWSLGALGDADHTTKMEYRVNSDNEVMYFNVDDFGQLGMHFYYKRGELFKNVVKNENWTPEHHKDLNTNIVYTDKNGRKVATVTYREAGNAEVEKLMTYYVYDDFGRLRYVIPPKAVRLLEPILTSQRYEDVAPITIERDKFTYSTRGFVSGTGKITVQLINNRLRVDVNGNFDAPRRGRNGTKIKNSTPLTIIASLPIAANVPDLILGDINTAPYPNIQAVKMGIQNGVLTLNDNYNYSYLTSIWGSYFSPFLFKNVANTQQVKNILDDLAFQYQYDEYNRQIAQKTPGKGWEYVVYDQLDRQVLVQDANLKKDNLWLFTKYDVYGRPVYSGTYSSTSNRVQLQAQLNTFIETSSNKANVEQRINSTSNILGTPINYSGIAFPNTGITELFSVTYYDNYSFSDVDKPSTPDTIEGQKVTTRTKGLLTSSWVKTLGDNTWSKSYNYYDERGRAIKTYEKNHLDGYTNTDTSLDFRGNTLQSITTHQKDNASELLTITDKFKYGHAFQLVEQTQQINSQPEELVTRIQYDALGNIEEKSVGGALANANALQNVNYKYNIRGWLKEVNKVDALENDLFAFKLNYNEQTEGNVTDGKALFNGNISQAIWRSKHDNFKQSYAYRYDALNQLTDANYLSGDGLFRRSDGKLELHNLRYDQNGNILGLTRVNHGYGNPADPNSKTQDILTYNYASNSSNQLTSITDTGDKTEGFIDGNTSGDDYAYDDNGNLTKDLNKGISLIEYNHLDLVKKVHLTNGKSILFTYDASGRKLAKTFVNDGTTNTTTYLGSFQYQNGQLQFFPTAEGYAYRDTNNTYKYSYIYADQLGNNRVSYSDTDGNGEISNSELLSNTNYYPMGGIHFGAFNAGIASSYNYKFQGKEMQYDGNIQLYDFGSRMYDPTVGRWFGTDPQNQFHSPYVAMGNSYIISIDPDGEWVHIAIGAVVGGAINLAVNWKNIDNFWEGAAAFGTGALAGGLTAACGACGAGAIAGIGAGTGALTAATNNVIAQTDNERGLGDVKWNSVGQSAFVGFVAGGASSVASSWATNSLSAPLINNLKITSPLAQGAINGTVGGAAGGFIGGATGGLLTTGTWDGAIEAGIDGLSSGAIIGLGVGVGTSYINSVANNIDPITGKPVIKHNAKINSRHVLNSDNIANAKKTMASTVAPKLILDQDVKAYNAGKYIKVENGDVLINGRQYGVKNEGATLFPRKGNGFINLSQGQIKAIQLIKRVPANNLSKAIKGAGISNDDYNFAKEFIKKY